MSINRAQNTVDAARAALVRAVAAVEAAKRAHPLFEREAAFNARCDAADKAHDSDLADRVLEEWKADGCSDVICADLRPQHQAEREARTALKTAEEKLFAACLATMRKRAAPAEALALLSKGATGELFNIDHRAKLVAICLEWSGK